MVLVFYPLPPPPPLFFLISLFLTYRFTWIVKIDTLKCCSHAAKASINLQQNFYCDIYVSSLLYQCSYVCFPTASLIKAMQYGGNLESENPIFFESVSSAIDASQIPRVRLTAGVGEVLGAHWALIKLSFGEMSRIQWTSCAEIFYLYSLQPVLNLWIAFITFFLLALSSCPLLSLCSNFSIFYAGSRGVLSCSLIWVHAPLESIMTSPNNQHSLLVRQIIFYPVTHCIAILCSSACVA